ncbi:cilia- and flagella-associated protein [Pimephales promelas]|nr:cilia- and flagella-associated protein [Pimephales promelas]
MDGCIASVDVAFVRRAHALIGSSQSELRVVCAEQALQLGCREIAQDCLKMYLEGKPAVNQFLCRAYLCQAQLVSSHSITSAEDLDKAVMFYLKAIEIAKDKSRYHFLVFNASLLFLRSVRLFLRPGKRQNLVSSLTQVVEALEEVQDPDHGWRAELMIHLVECLLDAGTREEAVAMAKVTSDFIESHKPELYPRLFSIQVRHNLMDVSEKLNDKNPKLLVIYKIQKLKHMVDINELRRDEVKALKEVFLLLMQSSKPKASDIQGSRPPAHMHSSSAPPNIPESSPLPMTHSSSAPPNIPESSPLPIKHSPSAPPNIPESSPPPITHSSSTSPNIPESSPPPIKHSPSAPPNIPESSPPPIKHSSSAPPNIPESSPPPIKHSSSAPPNIPESSPPPIKHSPSAPPNIPESSPLPIKHSPSAPPNIPESSPPPIKHSSSAPPNIPESSPPPIKHSSSAPPNIPESSPPPITHSSSTPPNIPESSPPPIKHSPSAPPNIPESSPPPIKHSSSAPPNIPESSPPPIKHSSSAPPNIPESSPPPIKHSPSAPPNIPESSPPPIKHSPSAPPNIPESSPPPIKHSPSAPPNIPESSPLPIKHSPSAPPNIPESSPLSSSCSSSVCVDLDSSILLTDRVVFLIELAFLSPQLQQHDMALDCLKELSASNVTVGQRIMMECVQCELDLNKNRDGIENYSRSGVELQLSVIVRLDALLQTALKAGDAGVCEAVCVCLWNACLPLLQHNLRKRVQKPLLTLARALDSTDSMLLEVCGQVHAELAAVDEEDEKLESAMKHLHKAAGLDVPSEHLSSSLHLLQLRSSGLSAHTHTRCEDQAARLMQQATEGEGPESLRKRRPLLVSAGLALAPEAFRTVLDADRKIKGDGDQDHVTHLAAKAQHHMTCVQKVEGHLAGLDKSSDDKERVRLWASLAKIGRKQEVFDVCRAACRFCLLYDDGRWESSSKLKNGASPERRNQTDPLLRLLAEVHFINAEVTILKLRSEGVELNGSAVTPDDRGTRPPEEGDAHWTLYSDWIKGLSAYATGHFLRGAELGAELGEAWLVANAAVYLWNYNTWLLATRGHRLLLPTFSRLLQLLRHTGHAGETSLVVLLCDAVAQGLIEPWCVSPVRADQEEKADVQPAAEKTKKVRGKSVEKSGPTHGPGLDAAALQDVKKALEVCEFALKLSNGNAEPVPLLVRRQILSSWVSVKQLLHQQIGPKLDINDESKSEAVVAVSRVLVAMEMLRCNRNTRLMEFSVPSLSVLVSMATGCQWTDPVLELCVWTQLALYTHQTHDHDLLMTCTQNALQLEHSALHRVNTHTYALVSVRSVQEMLSSAACVRGQSLTREARGHQTRYMEGLRMLQSSVSFAAQACSWCVCVTAAGHYWNACVPLLDSRADRRQLREPLELILKAMMNTYRTHTPDRSTGASGLENDGPETPESTRDDELTVCVSMINALLLIHADTGDWKRSLKLLDEAVGDMPHTHRPVLLKQRVLVKARLGESVLLDMQRFRDEDEIFLSHMWRRAALCAKHTHQRLSCYQNAIAALKSPGAQWQKVDVLLEFGEWLHVTHFPATDVRLPIEWAADILMFPDEESVASGVCVREVRAVGRLERLMRTHTLLAVVEERSSHTHLQHLLTALSFTLNIWKVSMETAQEVRNRSAVRPDDKKPKQPSPVEDKPRGKAVEVSLPISPEEWAQFECPEELRQAFGSDDGPYSINGSALSAQSRTLFYLDLLVRELESVSLTPLTFAPLHLAEVIAHDLMKSRSQSDLYRLRIIRNCRDVGFECPYGEQLLSFTRVPEDEQMRSQKAVLTHRHGESDQTLLAEEDPSRRTLAGHWLAKADVCISMNLFEPAKVLLNHTHLIAEKLGDQTSLAESLHLLAVLANQEQRYREAVVLCERALEIGGDEEFLHRLVQTLMSAVAGRGGQDTHHQVCEITEQACRTIRAVLEQRRNRASVLRFFMAALETRGAVLRRRLLRPASPLFCLSDADLQMLTSVCDTLTHTSSELLQLRYRTHSAEAMREHADTLRMLAVHASSVEEKQRHLLHALAIMKKAVFTQQEVVAEALNVLPPHESGWRNLPAVRVCVCLRLALADLALFMLDLQCAEDNRKSIIRDRKCSVERALEDFISADLTEHERDWSAVGLSLAQDALTLLSSVTSLSLDCVETRARSLGMLGRCLRILAQQRDPLYPCTLWDEPVTDEDGAERRGSQDYNEEEEEQVKTDTEKRPYAGKSAELQSKRRAAQRLLAQASETLSQSLSLSLHHDLPHLLPHVCSDLLECHGQFDLGASGQFLALLQSGVCCAEMCSVLLSICSGVSGSQVCALMNLREKLLSSQGHRPDGVLTAVSRELSRLSKAFSHLTINPNHLRILGEMPPNFRILLLQHSEDSSVLYGGYYEKVKATETQKGKSVTGGLICSRLVKACVHRSSLLKLHKHLEEFKRLSAQTHEGKAGKRDECFKALLEEMEQYLHPVLSQLDFSCFSVGSPSFSTSARAKDKEEKTTDKLLADPGECVVILADRMLLEFPLEALSVLQADGIGSVSRDFSLQVLHARLQTDDTVTIESDNKKEAKGVRGVKGRADQSRGIKAVLVNRVPPPHTVPVDTHRFRYVVDSQEEEEEDEEGKWADRSPAESMRQSLDTHSQLTAQWEGLMGVERQRSLADVEQLLMSCSAFIYSSAKSFFSGFPPVKMASLNLSGCGMLFLLDRAQKPVSVQKRRALAGSVGSGYLMTLGGVRSVLLNQWHSSASANARVLRSLMDDVLNTGLTSGRAAHVLRTHTSERAEVSATSGEGSAVNSSSEDVLRETRLRSNAFNLVIYGLPNVVVI